MKTNRVSRSVPPILRCWIAVVVVVAGIGLATNKGAAVPAAKPALLLWLDASDPNGDGATAHPGALAACRDKSGQAHHARQDTGDQRAVMVPDAAGPGLPALRFEAARREVLSCAAPAARVAAVAARAGATGHAAQPLATPRLLVELPAQCNTPDGPRHWCQWRLKPPQNNKTSPQTNHRT
jgi:hypothetical protein